MYLELQQINKSHILDISGKSRHVCALNTHNKIGCWGDDMFGETSIPEDIEKEDVVSVTADQCITCVVVKDGYVLNCWGSTHINTLTT